MMKKRKLWLGFMCCQAVILSRNSQANQKKHGKNTSFRLTAKSQIHSAGIQKHFSEDFEAIKRFAVTSYVSKSSKITDFAEAGWYVFSKTQKASQKKSRNGKPKDVNMRQLPSTEGVLLQHYLRSAVQTSIWHEATKACISHVDPQEYDWKPSDKGFIAITTEDDMIPELLLTVCGCTSSNCATRLCKCRSNGIPCPDLCSCRYEFC